MLVILEMEIVSASRGSSRHGVYGVWDEGEQGMKAKDHSLAKGGWGQS